LNKSIFLSSLFGFASFSGVHHFSWVFLNYLDFLEFFWIFLSPLGLLLSFLELFVFFFDFLEFFWSPLEFSWIIWIFLNFLEFISSPHEFSWIILILFTTSPVGKPKNLPGDPLPKCLTVDTKTHASCRNEHGWTYQITFPTMRGRT
jgi:hypothetical protein